MIKPLEANKLEYATVGIDFAVKSTVILTRPPFFLTNFFFHFMNASPDIPVSPLQLGQLLGVIGSCILWLL